MEENSQEYQEFLSIEEVAQYLHVYRDTVYRYIKDIQKPLPSIKISRKKILVKKVDLDNWLEEQKNA
jgi:excisionase family DNA binding protein